MSFILVENTINKLDFKFKNKDFRIEISEKGDLCLFVAFELVGYVALTFKTIEARKSLNSLLGDGDYLNADFYTFDRNSVFTICNMKEKEYISMRKEFNKFAKLHNKNISLSTERSGGTEN